MSPTDFKWHVIYWCHVFIRWIRWPFFRWARHAITLREYIAGIKRDPETRRLLEDSRLRMQEILRESDSP